MSSATSSTHRTVYEYDSIGRAWIRCAVCGRKTPAWQSSASLGPAKRGTCRWCGEHWGDWPANAFSAKEAAT